LVLKAGGEKPTAKKEGGNNRKNLPGPAIKKKKGQEGNTKREIFQRGSGRRLSNPNTGGGDKERKKHDVKRRTRKRNEGEKTGCARKGGEEVIKTRAVGKKKPGSRKNTQGWRKGGGEVW